MDRTARNNALRGFTDESLVSIPADMDFPPMPVIIEHAGHSHWASNISSGRKYNPLFAIELVTAGDLILIQDGRECLVERGMVFFLKLRSTIQYRTGPSGYVHKRFVALSGPFVGLLLEHFGLESIDTFPLSNVAALSELIKKAYSILSSPDLAVAAELSELAYRILVFLACNKTPSRIPAPLQSAISFLNNSINRTPSAEEIADAASMSVAHFYRLFQSHFKQSPLRYHTEMKMKRAQQQLAFTSIPIKQIAWECDYKDTAYFSNVFKKHCGMCPRAWRQQHQTPA